MSKPLRRDQAADQYMGFYSPRCNRRGNNVGALMATIMSTLQNDCNHLWQLNVIIPIS